MAPDLNSLPPSRASPTTRSTMPPDLAASIERGQSPSPSSRSASISLQATAAVNAGLRHGQSRPGSSSGSVPGAPQSPAGRHRSTVLMNLQLNDPTLPPPAEMVTDAQQANPLISPSPRASPPIHTGDPHHLRNPSLGEIHQEIEQEQEAQVNRLLQMIRAQQQELQTLQAASGQQPSPAVVDDSTPTSERRAVSRPPSTHMRPRASFDFVRRSRTPSQTASPPIRPTSMGNDRDPSEPLNLSGRDESAFYQAETQMLTRENQMLRQRIRELERQVSDLHANSNITREPSIPSQLLSSESVSEEPETTAQADTPIAPEGPGEGAKE